MPVLCSIIAVLGLSCVALLVLWHVRVTRRRRRLREEYLASTQTAANNQNQDNIRRYRNPLFAPSDKRGVPKAVPTEELHELDMEKFDKNPARYMSDELDKLEKSPGRYASGEASPDLNAIADYRRQPKKNNQKNINIHLSNMSETEVVV